MATYVLLPGAASDAWYWHRVIPLLRARGHDVLAPDLPCEDDSAGFPDYADTVVRAIGGRDRLILVAQSLAGFTAPLVCERIPVELLVLVAAMVPSPGESAGDWWSNTGQVGAYRELAERHGLSTEEFDVKAVFFHDVPPEVTREAFNRRELDQSATPLADPWPLTKWPDVPTEFLLCRQDRLFPAEFMRELVKSRLGIVPDELNSGHLSALSHPAELVERLEKYRTSHGVD
ncbi:MAG: alpha/beta hydrolase [Corynebacteriales bacterium]|nr:alpha/beta hydrolase [Mycobacteriales bacterium]